MRRRGIIDSAGDHVGSAPLDATDPEEPAQFLADIDALVLVPTCA